jgi:hypothetical protein
LDHDARSIGDSFHCLVASSPRARKRRSCSSSLTENQYLRRWIPERDEHVLELGCAAQELGDLGLGGEAHDPFHTGAVVPRPVEEDDLTGCRQLLGVALEVPLGAFAVGRDTEGLGAHDAVVGPIGDPADDAALAGGVAPLEQDHHPVARLADPVLHLDQLDLEAQQLGLVRVALQPSCLAVVAGIEHPVLTDGHAAAGPFAARFGLPRRAWARLRHVHSDTRRGPTLDDSVSGGRRGAAPGARSALRGCAPRPGR